MRPQKRNESESMRRMASALLLGFLACVAWSAFAQEEVPGQPAPRADTRTVPGMPPVIDRTNLYSETAAGKVRPDVAMALPRIYVPNRRSNDVSVIDPATLKVVDRFKVGVNPQHVVP